MSKTTDALDWAYERGRAMGRIAGQQSAFSMSEPASYSIPTEPVGFEQPEATGVDPMDDPELQDVSPIPGYDAEAVARKEGWNEALDFARDEILENFDTLIRTAQQAVDAGGNPQTEVMNLIDQRIAELKR